VLEGCDILEATKDKDDGIMNSAVKLLVGVQTFNLECTETAKSKALSPLPYAKLGETKVDN
jgi:hypothetical protein